MICSTSLVAVFIPILLMPGIVGRLFREFAVVLSAAIGVSLLVSLTMTPTMCAKFLRPADHKKHNFIYRAFESLFDGMLRVYGRSLNWVLGHQPFTLGVTIATACLSIYLYILVPKGFFPQQDTGQLIGRIQADQSISFQAMREKLADFITIVRAEPAPAEGPIVPLRLLRRARERLERLARGRAILRARGLERSALRVEIGPRPLRLALGLRRSRRRGEEKREPGSTSRPASKKHKRDGYRSMSALKMLPEGGTGYLSAEPITALVEPDGEDVRPFPYWLSVAVTVQHQGKARLKPATRVTARDKLAAH